MCVGAGICRRTGKKRLVNTLGRNNTETKTTTDANSTTHTLFTSVWEELGVYLLESFLIYDATWTLLRRERETEREGEEVGDINGRYQPEGRVQ